MDYKSIILNKITDYYYKQSLPIKRVGKITMLQCPKCKSGFTTTYVSPNTSIHCYTCKGQYTILDIVKLYEPNVVFNDEESIYNYLKNLLNLDVKTALDDDNIVKKFELFNKLGWSLVPIIANDKIPIEKDWTNKEHKNITEWNYWYEQGLNLGVRTGQVSGITIIDIDQSPLPEEIKSLVGDTMMQITNRGFHYIYQYDEQLATTRIDSLKIDILNNGKQCIIDPSKVENKKRELVGSEIKPIPEAFKQYLLNNMTIIGLQPESEKLREDIKAEKLYLPLLKEGDGRNNFFIKLGGILRKDLNMAQTEFTIKLLNKTICEVPLPDKEISAMVGSLDKYVVFEEKELADKILKYLRIAGGASKQEVSYAILSDNAKGEGKHRLDKAIQYLINEHFIHKKGREYKVLKKIEWKDSLINNRKLINFKMPYFDDIMRFYYRDMIIIGGMPGVGKTNISMNMVKRFVEQGIKPYYFSLEANSRFEDVAMKLGLKDGDFHISNEVIDPLETQFEENAVTIIDWLDPSSEESGFAQVNKWLRHFNDQIKMTDGLLIVFMQLKQNEAWFAENLIKAYPVFAAKYLYEKDENGKAPGIYGRFHIDKIRESKQQLKTFDLPCKFNWETKELKRIDELKENER